MGREPFLKLQCPISNCLVTDDRSLIKIADAVLVSFRNDFKVSDLPSLWERSPNQLWTFVLWESPEHTYDWRWQRSRVHYRTLKDFSNFFNWTMTYRLDSDVTFHYGRYVRTVKPNLTMAKADRLANKTRTAVWISSHCDTPSHREILVSKLKEHIDVDVIGSCAGADLELTNGVCAHHPSKSKFTSTSEQCFDYLSSTYKFYLAFENSLCRDYVTEKFYRAAQMDLIPVVFNGADMSLFAPPNSFIDARQFSSSAKLATFLKQVGSDSELYNSYFWWKPFYDVEQMSDQSNYLKHFCDLCAKVTLSNHHQEKPTTYSDIDNWWAVDGNCYNIDIE